MTGSDSIARRRHTPSHPCPICGGHAAMPHGRGVRCAGFTLDLVAYCTREELAGRLPLDIALSPPAYKHRLKGECACGTTHLYAAPLRVGRAKQRAAEAGRLSIDERDAVYSYAFGLLSLRPEARADLQRRGLEAAEIEAFPFISVPLRQKERGELAEAVAQRFGEHVVRRCPGFHDKNRRLVLSPSMVNGDGYFVPYVDEAGRITGFQMKVLGGKYLTPFGARYAEMYVVAGERSDPLYVVEGGLKTIVASCLRPAWCFGVPGQSLQPEHVEVVKRLNPARVAVALDRETNAQTDRLRQAWLKTLTEAGLATYDAVWEQE